MATNEQFYRELPAFTEFNGLFDSAQYQPAPSDWWVVITDVKGSTLAIEQGRYRDVNTIGAASIASLQNVMGTEPFPFAFGGDGATALIPGHQKSNAESELNALRKLAEEKFGLGLRVGMVSIAELEEENLPVLVAKYQLKSQYPLAVFRGGALTRAEEKVKADEAKYEIPVQDAKETDLSNLSCRWQALPAQNGRIITLIVTALTANKPETYASFTKSLEEIMDGRIEEANPVKPHAMRYLPLMKMLRSEARFQSRFTPFVLRMLEIIMAWMIFGTRLFKLIRPMRHYVESNPSHSDYRKFDDMLRMVLDCSKEQSMAIQRLCETLYNNGDIRYGIHYSEEAVMTCYVPTMKDGEHIHFIDGGDGGYAMAAKQMKAQSKAAAV
jgi:hypothetical protein